MSGSLYMILSEQDQKKFGCTDRLRFALLDVTAREQATLQRAFGYHTLDDMADAMRGMVDLDTDGKVTKARRDPNLYLAFTWLALRHNNYLTARRADDMTTELADLDIQLSWTTLDFDPEDGDGDGGKDDGSTPTVTLMS